MCLYTAGHPSSTEPTIPQTTTTVATETTPTLPENTTTNPLTKPSIDNNIGQNFGGTFPSIAE